MFISILDDLCVKGDVHSDEPTVNYHSTLLFPSAFIIYCIEFTFHMFFNIVWYYSFYCCTASCPFGDTKFYLT